WLMLIKEIFSFNIYRKLSLKFDLNDTLVLGADHIYGARYFLRKHKFYLLEDGTANYSKSAYIRSWKNKLFSLPKFGMYYNVKKIYLTKDVNDNMPECVKNKVEKIDIIALWNSLSELEKQEILDIFNITTHKLNSLKKRKYILFTQPLSEDGVITEEEKISIYRKIIIEYGENNIIIKPHPREKTDYSSYFAKVKVFSKEIPAEFLNLLGINFEKVITLFSTAVFDYPREKIDFYGTSVHPKILERFGNIKYNS
ncbi:glycosyltransferase family 52, partial [Gallibacterium anatis]|uniref:glycosyltransferase family 52 n=1 Tax=Gallibacterium anatis TaxID=750 RepID=UPI0039FD1E08